MMLALIVWFVMTVFPVLKGLAIFGTIVAVVFTGVSGLYALIEDQFGPIKAVAKQLKWVVPVLLLLHMVPSEKTSWYMVGAYATQTIVQSETGKELAGDSLDVLKSLINKSKEYIDSVDVKKDAPAVKTEQPKGEKA